MMLIDSAFLLLLGFILAGIIHRFLNERSLGKLLSGSPGKIVFKAALLGIPLPLCSCSVLPVAHQLRKSGLTKGGTAAFLISTPETGVDSILLTYSLCDPLMTVARPVSAFVTAVTAGFIINNNSRSTVELSATDDSCADSCCSSNIEQAVPGETLTAKIKSSVSYALSVLLKDLAPYLLVGYLLAGLVDIALGDQFSKIPAYLVSGWGGYLGAVLIGVPMYICATSSTPLAAVLLFSGFSPGAVLVFLLVGPATNLASLTVVSKIFSKKITVVYLMSIIFVAVVSGIVLDFIYDYFQLNSLYDTSGHEHQDGYLHIISAVILSGAVLYHVLKKWLSRLF